jgi:DNA primase
MRVTSSGNTYILCVFHTERTPSLRIKPNGLFTCYGCGQHGHVRDHPELKRFVAQSFNQEFLESEGQLRLPFPEKQ